MRSPFTSVQASIKYEWPFFLVMSSRLISFFSSSQVLSDEKPLSSTWTKLWFTPTTMVSFVKWSNRAHHPTLSSKSSSKSIPSPSLSTKGHMWTIFWTLWANGTIWSSSRLPWKYTAQLLPTNWIEIVEFWTDVTFDSIVRSTSTAIRKTCLPSIVTWVRSSFWTIRPVLTELILVGKSLLICFP